MARILVIEDTAVLRQEIAATLAFEGFEAAAAENGIAGLEVARTFRPDLILCDIMMPGLDGFETMKALQRNESTAGIPVIFITAKAARDDVRQGMEAGADDYITKPFTTEELLRAVRARLKRREQQQDEATKRIERKVDRVARLLPGELRTPLHGIAMLAKLMEDEHETIDRSDIGDYAREILGACARLDRVIGSFLMLAEIEVLTSGGGRRAPRTLPPVDAREEILAVAMNVAAAVGRVADLELAVGEAWIHVEPEHLEKLVKEVLDNAFRYSKPGTPVRLACTIKGATASVTITDRGRGLSAGEIEMLETRSRAGRGRFRPEGLGLGLTLSRRLVELYGGKLTLRSEASTGTTVTIELPAVPAGWRKL